MKHCFNFIFFNPDKSKRNIISQKITLTIRKSNIGITVTINQQASTN